MGSVRESEGHSRGLCGKGLNAHYGERVAEWRNTVGGAGPIEACDQEFIGSTIPCYVTYSLMLSEFL